jgi:D-glycero-alpha-D-manno-heptose-7-phosphate kinase
VKLAYDLRAEFRRNNISSFGDILHEGWLLKKSLTKGISSPQIDNWYRKAREAGARGGKLLGAGSGGFMVFHAPVERHENIRSALSELREVKFLFQAQGSRIIFVH